MTARMVAIILSLATLCSVARAQEGDARVTEKASGRFSAAERIIDSIARPPAAGDAGAGASGGSRASAIDAAIEPEKIARSAVSVALFGAISLVPVALLVLTAFVRISIVLLLVRQALGSMQIPGNQVLTALALLLTALVMAPVGQRAYHDGIAPFADGRKSGADAWRDGVMPIKRFMGEQIIKYKHQDYLWTFYRYAVGGTDNASEPATIDAFPLRAVAPAFLVSELTTALFMGFAIYLPFLVVDLVVSVVLSTMGLFLLPPGVVAVPIKLALFVLADGWMLIADMLIRSFV